MPTYYLDANALIHAFKAGAGKAWSPGQVLPNDWATHLDDLVSGPGRFVTNSLILEEIADGIDTDGGVLIKDWLDQKLAFEKIELHELSEIDLDYYRSIPNGGERSLIEKTALDADYTADFADRRFVSDENLANKQFFKGYNESHWRNNPGVFHENFQATGLDADFEKGAEYFRKARSAGLSESEIFGKKLGSGADTFGDIFRKLIYDESGAATIPGGRHWDELSDFVRHNSIRLAGEAVGAGAIVWDAYETHKEFADALARGDLERADELLGGLIGRSFGGAFAAAIAGAAGFSVFGPPGIVIGAILGGIVGAIGGDEVGKWFFGELGELGLNISTAVDNVAGLLRDIMADPLVLDLDGDGIELIALSTSVTRFDLDKDGYAERAGWVGPHDGFLVQDANDNGVVDGVDELLGSAHVDGFDELRALDSNADNRIDAADPAFAQLNVWRDVNSDGVSTSDEMLSLTQVNITRFNLSYTAANTDVGGNIIARNGTFVRTSGATGKMSSVEFALDDRRPLFEIPEGADIGDLDALPNLNGVIGLPDLRDAMFQDPVLRSMVDDLVFGDHDFDTFAEFRDGGFLDVLYRWANIDTSTPPAPGEPDFSMQLLAAWMGRPFAELSPHQLVRVQDEVWPQFVQAMGVSFLFQAAQNPALLPISQAAADIAALDPASPTYLEEMSALATAAVSATGAVSLPYDYLEQFTSLKFNPADGSISGDFNAFVADFIAHEPSFVSYLAGGGGGRATMNVVGAGEYAHPWTAWYKDQGSLLFPIANAMGISSDYVLNVTGWRWMKSGMSEHEGTSGNDLLSFTTTTYYSDLFSWTTGVTHQSTTTHDQRLYGYEGDDELRGNDGVDSLIGGPGNDLLKGGSGSDMYVYALGDGLDRITDDSGSADAIYFSSEFDREDLIVSRPAGTNDFLLHFGDPAAGIVLTNQWTTASTAIEQLYFVGEDGMNAGDIASRYLSSFVTSGNDTVTGGWADETIDGLDGNDTLSGGTGDDHLQGGIGQDTLSGGDDNDRLDGDDGADTLVGGNGIDTLMGGAGNDLLSGNSFDDTYVFNLGDGQDTIRDNTTNVLTPGNDTLLFGADITPGDITVTQVSGGTDLRISINGTTDSVLLDNDIDEVDYRIEQVQFADGTVLKHADLMRLATTPTSGNDVFYGSYNREILQGGVGNDTLYGRGENDTLIGGAGNDLVIGGTGDDTYVFNLGDGQDIIRDNTGNVLDGGYDTLVFGADITADSNSTGGITVTQTGGALDLLITINGTADSVLLDNDIDDDDYRIDRVQFADGTSLTHAQLMTLATTPTSGNDVFYGSYNSETLQGGAGNDTLYGRDGNDTLLGGEGNDLLVGNTGDDTYKFNLGDGQDIVRDNTGNVLEGGYDTLVFGAGITADSNPTWGITVTQAASGTDILIKINGTTDSVLLDNDIDDEDYRIERVQFADGTSLTHAQLMTLATTPTSGNDVFYGSYNSETLQGGAGNDTLYGRDGNDTLLGGEGNDYLDGGAGTDLANYSDHFGVVVTLATSSAQVVAAGESDTLVAVENITGSSGDDTLTGSSVANALNGADGNDRLKGGAGNDTLSGGLGTDIAIFSGLQASYTVLTSGGTVSVKDDQTSTDGNDGTDVITGIETLEFKGGVQVGVTSPIVLDLDGLGVTTLSAGESHARFDLNGDGKTDDTSWIGATEGFLFLDRNGDGALSGVRELSFVDDVPGAASDLAGLAAFDSDLDGRLSGTDAQFGSFGVWRDGDGDGVVDAGELVSLEDAGVASIGLTGTAIEGSHRLGETIAINSGSYLRSDGREFGLIDAALTYFAGDASEERTQATPTIDILSRRQRRLESLGSLTELMDRVDSATAPRLSSNKLAEPASNIDPGLARKLLLMRQDLSAFGAAGVESLLRDGGENARPMDWYA